MPGFSKRADCERRPRGLSRNAALVAGCASLLVALALFFAWQGRILSHLHFEPARTEVLRMELLAPDWKFTEEPAPPVNSMSGGVIVRMGAQCMPVYPATVQ